MWGSEWAVEYSSLEFSGSLRSYEIHLFGVINNALFQWWAGEQSLQEKKESNLDT